MLAHVLQEDLPDLGPVAMDRRDNDVAREVVAQLDYELRQVRLRGIDAGFGQGLVEPGLRRGHRFDLHDFAGAGALDNLDYGPVSGGGALGEMHVAAGPGDVGLEFLEQLVQPAEGVVLNGGGGGPQLVEVGQFPYDPVALAADGRCRPPEIGAQLCVRDERGRCFRERGRA